MQIRCSWIEPQTNTRREPTLTPPVAFGRDLATMQQRITGNLPRMVISHNAISSYHCLIDIENHQLVVIDQNSSNGTFVNNIRQNKALLNDGDILKIGGVEITINIIQSPLQPQPQTQTGGKTALFNAQTGTILFNQKTGLIGGQQPQINQAFPPPEFMRNQELPAQNIHAFGYPVIEKDYLALGGGLGSYIWTDLLRIWGVNANRIMSIGLEDKPYFRYQQLCINSQIPAHERLRSNSDSCPDNIWGFPSYAWREVWYDFFHKSKINTALRYLWQVFSEPDLIETYTPRSQNVFDSIDRETSRIGWNQIYTYGSIRAMRKTQDGRYAIAYSKGSGNYGFAIGKYVHIALGYPGIRLLEDLAEYRQRTGDDQSVVNAYEEHDHVYKTLEREGGTVIIRGRGIVASRLIQRIYEVRKNTGRKDVKILHLMRSEIVKGSIYGSATRLAKNHQELQPFNWPKACWGGDLRVVLEKATPEQRKELLKPWGGTTTADRKDWQEMIEMGLKEGWYNIRFGDVVKVEKHPTNDGTITTLKDKQLNAEIKLDARFIIDATGLPGTIDESPLISDLQKTYNLEINPMQRLAVANDFEVLGMRTQIGRMYAAGAMTFGGPHAAVDSFLGLQYSALVSVDSLANISGSGVKYLNGISSLVQWWKWVLNQPPD